MQEFDTSGTCLYGHFNDDVICVPPVATEPHDLSYWICEALPMYKV